MCEITHLGVCVAHIGNQVTTDKSDLVSELCGIYDAQKQKGALRAPFQHRKIVRQLGN